MSRCSRPLKRPRQSFLSVSKIVIDDLVIIALILFWDKINMVNTDHLASILQLPAYKRKQQDIEQLMEFTKHIEIFKKITQKEHNSDIH